MTLRAFAVSCVLLVAATLSPAHAADSSVPVPKPRNVQMKAANDAAGIATRLKAMMAQEPALFGNGTTLVHVGIIGENLYITFGGQFHRYAGKAAMMEELIGRLTKLSTVPNLHLLVLGADGVAHTQEYYIEQAFKNRRQKALNEGPRKAASKSALANEGSQGGFPYSGALSGKRLAISPGHGWYYTGSTWTTQRYDSYGYGIVEDFTNFRMGWHIIESLEHAGAFAFSVRERDINAREVISDYELADSGYSESGTWAAGSNSGGYNDGYRTHSAVADGKDYAAWRPFFPMGGNYAVYVRYREGDNRLTAAPFTVRHAFGENTVLVDQTQNGQRWLYIGTYWFDYGSTTQGVYLYARGANPAQYAIADAVKFGGGKGSMTRGTSTSGKPRWQECSVYWSQFAGAPASIYANSADDHDSDICGRTMYATWQGADAYLSLHTNAAANPNVGTGFESYIHNTAPSAGSANWRNVVHNRVMEAIRAEWDSDWVDRGKLSANFGELRELPDMPGALIEVAFHDNKYDAEFIKRPRFRETVARAITRAALDYLVGTSATLFPLPVSNLRIEPSGTNKFKATWTPTTDPLYSGAEATSYRIYLTTYAATTTSAVSTQTDTFFTFNAVPGTRYVLRVAALNTGGESFISEPMAARLSTRGKVDLLIVNGFDRLDKSVQEEENNGTYAIRHALAIEAGGDYGYATSSNEAVEAGLISLATYRAVDWIAGEEARIGGEPDSNLALRPNDRGALKPYLEGGGRLLITGSEIAWDADASSDSVYEGFVANTLKATYVGDDANEYAFKGTSEGPFAGLNGNFDDGTQGSYDVNFPEILDAGGGSALCMTYGTTTKGLGVCYSGSDYRLVYLGVPLETFYPAATRATIMKQALLYLLGEVEPPLDGDSDTEDSDTTVEPDGDTTDSETAIEPDGDANDTESLVESDSDTNDSETANEQDGDTGDTDTIVDVDGDTTENDSNVSQDGDTEAIQEQETDKDGQTADADESPEADSDTNLCREGYVFDNGACIKQGGGSGGGCGQTPTQSPALFLLSALFLVSSKRRRAPWAAE